MAVRGDARHHRPGDRDQAVGRRQVVCHQRGGATGDLRSFVCVRKAEEEGRLELIGLYFDIGAAAARLVLEREPYLVRADEELATAGTPADL